MFLRNVNIKKKTIRCHGSFIAEPKSGSSSSGPPAKETKDNVGGVAAVVVGDESSYGYVSTKRVPLSSLGDRTQTPRGSIIPENCFETKVIHDFVSETVAFNPNPHFLGI
jgi:hypothetical protein